MVRVTVCELPDFEDPDFEDRFDALVDHAAAADSDLVVLPELPFGRWLPAWDPDDVDVPSQWSNAVASHDRWIEKLDAFDATVVGSQPITRDGDRYNAGFVRTSEGVEQVHEKCYLPEEPGFREAAWYSAGDDAFEPCACAGLDVGFLICTDLWASDEVRAYGRAGVDLLVNPRVTERRTLSKWLAGARTMSVLAGSYLASSNRAGETNGVTFGGNGWLTSPEGTVLARTDADHPFATADVDPAVVERASATYPRDALRRGDGDA